MMDERVYERTLPAAVIFQGEDDRILRGHKSTVPARQFERHKRRHRVSRVLSFFSSRRNWNSFTPLAAGECAPPPPPLVGGGEVTLAGGRGAGEVPIPTNGHPLWCSVYISNLWEKTTLQGGQGELATWWRRRHPWTWCRCTWPSRAWWSVQSPPWRRRPSSPAPHTWKYEGLA